MYIKMNNLKKGLNKIYIKAFILIFITFVPMLSVGYILPNTNNNNPQSQISERNSRPILNKDSNKANFLSCIPPSCLTGFVGSDFQAAYQISPIFSAYGYPTTETIVVLGYSNEIGINTGIYEAPFNLYDINTFFSNYYHGSRAPTLLYASPDNAPAPLTQQCISGSNCLSNGNAFENTMDIELAGSTAPGSTIIFLYRKDNSDPVSLVNSLLDMVINPGSYFSSSSTIYNKLTNTGHLVITTSYGKIGTQADVNDPTFNSNLIQLTNKHIPFLAASGDDGHGDYASAGVEFPANAAGTSNSVNYGVISVGGTTVTLTGSASADGTGTTGMSGQNGWIYTTGGVSTTYSEPSWQLYSSNANSILGGSHRGVPDLGAAASSILVYFNSTLVDTGGGTSSAAPITAGEVASMNYYAHMRDASFPGIGFFLPTIYRYGQLQYNNNGAFTSSTNPFFDVTSGSTDFNSALPGYDLVTGWGSMNAYNFISAYMNGPSLSTSPSSGVYVENNFNFYVTYRAPNNYLPGITHPASTIVLYSDGAYVKTYTITNSVYGTTSAYTVNFSSYSANHWHTLKAVATDSLGHTSTINMQFYTYVYVPGGGGCNPFC